MKITLNKERKFPGKLTCAHELLIDAKNGVKGNSKGDRYALPAFNVTSTEGIDAAFEAFETLGSSGLVAFSNSALKHLGKGDALKGLEFASEYIQLITKDSKIKYATHLDHGDYLSEGGKRVVRGAISCLSSVMADNSTDHANKKPTELEENIQATREVVQIAHPMGVSVEGELGVLAGVEDEDTQSEFSTYTDPEELKKFLIDTSVLMLAPTIGTMHGPNKGKPGDKVELNIELANTCLNLANEINPEILFVAHGASTLYPQVVDFAVQSLEKLGVNSAEINTWKNFVGTDWEQITQLIKNGFCKINTDTENRQTYLSALLGAVSESSSKVDIRYYNKKTHKALVSSYIQKLIMTNNYGVWYEPKIDVNSFKFDLSLL